MSSSNINIDESEHVAAPTVFQRLKHAVSAVVLGVVLVQMYYFYGAVKSGSFVPASFVIYSDSPFFIGYLVICGVLGWLSGRDFLDWLNVKIGEWKFW